MKFHLLVNSGSSLHGIETVEIPDDVWRYITESYNPDVNGGQAAVFHGARVGEQLHALVMAPTTVTEREDGTVDTGWNGRHYAAIQHLADLNRALSTHHAAIVQVEKTDS